MSSRTARSYRRRHVSSSVEEADEPAAPLRRGRAAAAAAALPVDTDMEAAAAAAADADAVEGEEMTPEKVAEMWAEFSADHYEIVEQLPLELHRNSRLLRELDLESLSQQDKLQAAIREYAAYRVGLARPKIKVEVDEVPVEPAAEAEAAVDEPAAQTPGDEAELEVAQTTEEGPAPDTTTTTPGAETTAAAAKGTEETVGHPPKAEDTAAVKDANAGPVDKTPPPRASQVSAQERDASWTPDPDADGEADADAAGSPDPDAMGTPDPGPDPDADAAGSPDPNPKASDTAQQSRQSSVDVGAVEDVVGMDEDTPALTPRASALAPPASAAQATVMAAVTATATVTPAATATAAATPAPAPRVHPATAALGSIARLIRELVRNREEKVAIARGAYDTIDRHIRALDTALDGEKARLAPESDATPEAHDNKDKKRKGESAVPPPTGVVIPPDLEIDPNEPRYCYCNNVSFGEMVGCDNEDCPYEWFHLACLGLTVAPVGNWLCEACKPGGTGVKAVKPSPKGRPVKRRKK